jgi:hypothetical protein
MGMFQANSFNTNGDLVETPLPYAGHMSYLRVSLSAAPGADDTWTFQVTVAGADTPLKCSITGPAASCADSSNSVAMAAGALVAVHISYAGAGNRAPATHASWSARYANA